MKYFIDTEFIEGFYKPLMGKRRHFIDLISIGIVAEDGRTYYAISNEFNPKDADEWVMDNVIVKLFFHNELRRSQTFNSRLKEIGKSNIQIAEEIMNFCGGSSFKTLYYPTYEENIEFYGYYSDYDWVLFCSLFGRMIDLPKGFPMYCKDLKQSLDEKVLKLSNSDFFTKFHIEKEMTLAEKLEEIKKHTQYPQQSNEHNALDDAKWNYELYKFLQS